MKKIAGIPVSALTERAFLAHKARQTSGGALALLVSGAVRSVLVKNQLAIIAMEGECSFSAPRSHRATLEWVEHAVPFKGRAVREALAGWNAHHDQTAFCEAWDARVAELAEVGYDRDRL